MPKLLPVLVSFRTDLKLDDHPTDSAMSAMQVYKLESSKCGSDEPLCDKLRSCMDGAAAATLNASLSAKGCLGVFVLCCCLVLLLWCVFLFPVLRVSWNPEFSAQFRPR